MRRLLLVLVVAGLLVVAGCVDDPTAGEDIETDDAGSEDAPTDDGGAENGDDDQGEMLDGELEIHHLDVGQADATLLIAPNGETMLIDTGDWRQDGQEVLAYLDEQGIDRIDHLVATHGHADHIGGHAAIIETYETERDGIGAAYDSGVTHTSQTYENYLDAIETHDVELFEIRESDSLPFGDSVDVTVLNPPEDGGADLHHNSVSLAIEFGETRYLTTGDAETDAEARLVEEWADELDADLYHAGHHGSSTSSTEPFLDAVDPEFALISSAFDSQYGHPHDEILERFGERDIQTYWTGVHGDVVFSSDGQDLTVTTAVDESTDPIDLLDLKHSEENARLSADQNAIPVPAYP